MQKEYTITELCFFTGYTLEAILMLIKRGILPAGRKEGRTRYLPAECRAVLEQHEPGRSWRKHTRKAKPTWADLI